MFGIAFERFFALYNFWLEWRILAKQHIVIARLGLFNFDCKFLIHTSIVHEPVFIVKYYFSTTIG